MALKTLHVNLREGETLTVSGQASFRLESKAAGGNAVRVSVMADESVTINRPEKNRGAQMATMGVREK